MTETGNSIEDRWMEEEDHKVPGDPSQVVKTVRLKGCGDPECEDCSGKSLWLFLVGLPELDRWVAPTGMMEDQYSPESIADFINHITTSKGTLVSSHRLIQAYGLPLAEIRNDPLSASIATATVVKGKTENKTELMAMSDEEIEKERPTYLAAMRAGIQAAQIDYELETVLEKIREHVHEVAAKTGALPSVIMVDMAQQKILMGTGLGIDFSHISNLTEEMETFEGLGTQDVNQQPNYDNLIQDFAKTKPPKLH